MYPVLASRLDELVAVDFFGPLPRSQLGATYVFVVLGVFSKFLQLYPLRKATAAASVKRLLEFNKTIPVAVVLSDHGSQFTSRTWKERLNEHGIHTTYSSIRHPAFNPSERIMKELSRFFRTYCHAKQTKWADNASDIADCHNAFPHCSTGYCPLEVVTGRKPERQLTCALEQCLPSTKPEDIREIRRKVNAKLQAEGERQRQRMKIINVSLKIGDLVLLRTNPISKLSEKINHKLCPLYEEPYVISKNPHPNAYELREPKNGKTKGVYNISNLKPYATAATAAETTQTPSQPLP